MQRRDASTTYHITCNRNLLRTTIVAACASIPLAYGQDEAEGAN